MSDTLLCGGQGLKATRCNFQICSLRKRVGAFFFFSLFAFVFQIHSILHLTSVNGKLTAAQWPWLSKGQFGEGKSEAVACRAFSFLRARIKPILQFSPSF